MKNNDFKTFNDRGYKIIPISLKKALREAYTTAEEVEAKINPKGYFFIIDKEKKRALCIYNPHGIKTTTYKAITLYKELAKETIEEKPLSVDFILDIHFTDSNKVKSLTFCDLKTCKRALKLEQAKGSLTYTITKRERVIIKLGDSKPIEDLRLITIEDTIGEEIIKNFTPVGEEN